MPGPLEGGVWSGRTCGSRCSPLRPPNPSPGSPVTSSPSLLFFLWSCFASSSPFPFCSPCPSLHGLTPSLLPPARGLGARTLRYGTFGLISGSVPRASIGGRGSTVNWMKRSAEPDTVSTHLGETGGRWSGAKERRWQLCGLTGPQSPSSCSLCSMHLMRTSLHVTH